MPISPSCLEILGLHKAPFDALPDASFLYSDEVLDETVNCAKSALLEPETILLLTGPSGAGLSTQLMRVLSSLPEVQELVALRARHNTRFESIDRTLREHLRARSVEHQDRSLRNLLGERLMGGIEITLAIDDAHLLGTDILGLLFRLRGEILRDQGATFRLLLCGSPVLLRRRLPLDPEDRSPIARCTLRAFNLEQTAGYLRTRLVAAGHLHPEELITTSVVAELQEHSEGLPSRLNDAADLWLAKVCSTTVTLKQDTSTTGGNGRTEEAGSDPVKMAALGHIPDLGAETAAPEWVGANSTRTDPTFSAGSELAGPEDAELASSGLRAEDPDRAAPTTAAPRPAPFWNRRWFVPLLAMLFAVAILTPLMPRLFERPPNIPTTIELPLPPESPLLSLTEPRTATGGEPFTEYHEIFFDEPELATVDESGRPVAPSSPLTQIVASATSTAASAPAAATPPAAASVPAAATPPAAASVPAAATPPTAAPVPAAATPPTAAPVPAAATPPTAAPAPTAATPPTAAPAAASASSAPPAPTAAATTSTIGTTSTALPTPGTTELPFADLAADRAWIQRQDGRHLTIQLLAARDLQSARAFVSRHGLTGVRYIETRSGGREFVVVLAGSFPNRSAADGALVRLPEDVRAVEPWIRSIDSVRESQR